MQQSLTRRAWLRGSAGPAIWFAGAALLTACGGSATTTATTASSRAVATVAGPTTHVASSTQTVTQTPSTTATLTTSVTATAQAIAAGQKTTLRLFDGGNPTENNTIKAIVQAFLQANPDIKVSIEPITGDFATKIYAMAAANTLPDVTRTADVYTQPFASKKVLLNMQPLADRDKAFNINDIYPAMLNLGRTSVVPGGLFMIPRALDILVLFYNKTLFSNAGVPFPTATWTISDLVNAATKLSQPGTDPASAKYGINLNWTWWAEYVPWMRGYGGDIVSSDGKSFTGDQGGAVDGIQAMADLIVKQRVAPPTTMKFAKDPFTTGQVAMVHSIRDSVPTYRTAIAGHFEWDVQLWPRFPQKHVTGMGTQGFAVTSGTKHTDQAWALTSFVVSPAGQRVLASDYSTVPVRISLANDPSWRKLPPPPASDDVFTQSASIGTLPPVFPLNCGSVYTGQLNQIMSKALHQALTGATTAKTALQAAAQQINGCLAQNA